MESIDNPVSFAANKNIKRITDALAATFPYSYNNIHSYDVFMQDGIKEIMSKAEIVYEIAKKNEKTTYKVVKFDSANIIIDTPRKFKGVYEDTYLYPTEAVVQKYTYGSMIYADLLTYEEDENGEEIDNTRQIIKKLKITELPILVGSRYCNVKSLTEKEKANVGFCPDDPGGYFIIDGTEYVTVTQEKGVFNKIKVTFIKDLYRSEFISITGKITRSVSVFIKHPNVIKMGFSTRGDIDKVGSENIIFSFFVIALNIYLDKLENEGYDFERWLEDRDMSQHEKQNMMEWKENINLLNDSGNWALFEKLVSQYAISNFYTCISERGELGMKPGEEISKLEKFMYKYVDATIKDFGKEKSYLNKAISLVEFNKMNKVIAEYDNIKKARTLLAEMEGSLFPHIDDIHPPVSVAESQEMKLRILSDMCVKVCKAIHGYIQPDDRNDYKNRRLETSGILMGILFSKTFDSFIQTIKKDIKRQVHQEELNEDRIKVIKSVISTAGETNIRKPILKAIKQGKWGMVQNSDVRQNVTQILTRISKAALVADLMKISIPDDDNNKRTTPREVHLSQFGLTCPVKTPEGGKCGLVRFFAEQSFVTDRNVESHLLSILKPRIKPQLFISGKNDPYILLTAMKDNYNNLIDAELFLNNKSLGYCNAKFVANKLRHMKTHDELTDYTVSIVVKKLKDIVDEKYTVDIYTHEGRLTSPVFRVSNGKLVCEQTQSGNKINSNGSPISRFEDTTVSIDSYLKNGDIEYLDANERGIDNLYWHDELETWFPIIISTSYPKLLSFAHDVNYTHCMIDPALIFNPVASLVPFTSHIMAPRVAYFSNMGQQAMGIPMSSLEIRPDTSLKVAAYSQKPIVTTSAYERIGLNKSPAGMNVRVAIMPFGGNNQEDAIIVNKKSLELGLFNNTTYTIYATKLPLGSETKNVEEDKLNVLGDRFLNGIIRRHQVVQKGDLLTQKIWNSNQGRGETVVLTDARDGVVDRIFKQQSKGNKVSYKIRIRFPQVPIIGDKLSSRYAQKGVIGAIINDIDMPFDDDGMTPDLIVNPAMLPRRMTVSQLMEMLIGSAKGSIDKSRILSVLSEDFYIRLEEGVLKPNKTIDEFWKTSYIRTSYNLSSLSITPTYSSTNVLEPTSFSISFPDADGFTVSKNEYLYIIINNSNLRYLVTRLDDLYNILEGRGSYNMFPGSNETNTFPKNKNDALIEINRFIEDKSSPIYKYDIILGRKVQLGYEYDDFVQFDNVEFVNDEYVVKASTLKNMKMDVIMQRSGYKTMYDVIRKAWSTRIIPVRHIIGERKQILENRASKLEAQLVMDPFVKPDIKFISEVLREKGWNPEGEKFMTRGDTGERIKASIFTGYVYYVALKHLVGEKIQVRDRGALDPVNKQPIRGKSRGGGLRFGDMEVSALVAHGASHFVHEKLKTTSDETQAYYCKSCGNECYYNMEEQSYNCENGCDIVISDVAKVSIPYSLRFVRRYMSIGGMGMRATLQKSKEPRIKIKTKQYEEEKVEKRIEEDRTKIVVERVCEEMITEDILDMF